MNKIPWYKQNRLSLTQYEKNAELYKASLEAFFNNELESDKTILGLSVAAIGFYMALFLNKDLQITGIMFISIIVSLLCFLLVSGMILLIFIRNKKQLLHIVETTGGIKEDTTLEFLDKWKYLPFVIGIACSIIFTILLMFTKIHDAGKPMADKNESIKAIDTTPKPMGVITPSNSQAGVSNIVNSNSGNKDSNKTGSKDGK